MKRVLEYIVTNVIVFAVWSENIGSKTIAAIAKAAPIP